MQWHHKAPLPRNTRLGPTPHKSVSPTHSLLDLILDLDLPPVVESEHYGEGAGRQHLLVVFSEQVVSRCQGKSVALNLFFMSSNKSESMLCWSITYLPTHCHTYCWCSQIYRPHHVEAQQSRPWIPGEDSIWNSLLVDNWVNVILTSASLASKDPSLSVRDSTITSRDQHSWGR